MKLRILSPILINKIAAGEVIERPASVVKELVENAIDAGADEINVIINNGGRNLISISDNGKGMDKHELDLCIERHATSKLNDDDLFDINFLGFRGEAIPSIGSVSRMTISSRKKDAFEGNSIFIEGGEKHDIKPSNIAKGTRIEVKDLFFSTPARLKFLKTENTENSYIQEIITKLAITNPHIKFTLNSEKREMLNFSEINNIETRLNKIISKDFITNSVKFDAKNDGIRVHGFAALPTYSKGSAKSQYIYVNNRPVKDKLLFGSIKAAYQDYLARERYPIIVMFLEIDKNDVDVNVHPTKAEVRFHNSQYIRNFIVNSIRNALSGAGHKSATTTSEQAINSFKIENKYPTQNTSYTKPSYSNVGQNNALYSTNEQFTENKTDSLNETANEFVASHFNYTDNTKTQNNGTIFDNAKDIESVKHEPQENIIPQENSQHKLGLARCQLHENYIIAQTIDSIIIVDQHAAHERLVYEKMKIALNSKDNSKNIQTQRLLIPEIIEMTPIEAECLFQKQSELAKFGLIIDKFGQNSIVVRETPSILGEMDVQGLIKNLSADIQEHDEILSVQESFEHVLGTIACHGSVRSGRRLNVQEMNEILRQMESTPFSGQCNHGRPTYVELDLKDIEKLFGRR